MLTFLYEPLIIKNLKKSHRIELNPINNHCILQISDVGFIENTSIMKYMGTVSVYQNLETNTPTQLQVFDFHLEVDVSNPKTYTCKTTQTDEYNL